MKVLHVSFSDSSGGAARAALRIVQAQRIVGLSPQFWVAHTTSGDPAIEVPYSRFTQLYARARPYLAEWQRKRCVLEADSPISLAGLPTNLSSKINQSDADIVNLHWLNGNLMSIRDIGRIRKPCVWTLHDMWPFSGMLHCRFEGDTGSWSSPVERLEKYYIRQKNRFWKNPMTIVAPGAWLRSEVLASETMPNWQVSTIPVPLDTEIWRPIAKNVARQILGIDPEERIVLFGAVNGEHSRLKGFDILKRALDCEELDRGKLSLLLFGGSKGLSDTVAGIPARFLGKLSDDLTLRIVYSAADVFVNPSRIEAFGQTASEAQACGTPVVCFDNSGLRDVVKHEQTGYVAKAFSTSDLVKGINWVLAEPNRRSMLGQRARLRAKQEWNSERVGLRYREVYETIVSNLAR